MLGIDISDRSIKIVEITGGKKFELRSMSWLALAPNVMRRGVIQDVAVATATLQEAMQRSSPRPLEGHVAVVSIPETQSFVRVLEVPQMRDAEMDEAVQWAVRQHIPFDLERVYLDWQALPTLPAAENRQQVLVGAAQRDVIDPLLEVLDNAGLRVVALELEAQAIVRSLLPRQGSSDIRGVLIIDLGATSTNVVFFDQGVMRYTASILLGGDDLTQTIAHSLKIDPSVAAEKKALVGVNGTGDDSTVGFALREATVELLSRIQRVVQEMMAQEKDLQIRAILLSGGSANLPGISQVFAEVFPGIPVEVGNPWTNLFADGKQHQAPLSSADATHFVTAIGLGLRPEEKL